MIYAPPRIRLIFRKTPSLFQMAAKKRASSSSPRSKSFQRGNRVEILSNEEGFEGSYFPANIISRISKKEYIIQYRTLASDDGFRPLREVVATDHIRPHPPAVQASGFSLGDVVDAYEKDGWWVGKISGRTGSNYFVYFEKTSEKIAFPLGLLRVHQDWVRGVWVSPKR